MGQQLQPWRSGDGEKVWLLALIDAMEQVSCPEIRDMSCDQTVLDAFGAQLVRPASPYPYGASPFSLRN